MKKTLLTLLALAPMAVLAEDTKYWVDPTNTDLCYWVPGFSLDDPSTWYDVDKANNQLTGTPTSGDCLDGHYCWAATAANIVAQWENKNKEFVLTTQERAPKSAEAVFDEFIHTFEHNSGETSNATSWYFTGEKKHGLGFKPAAQNKDGGYYQGLVSYETVYGDPMFQENSGWTPDPEGGFAIWDSSVYSIEGNDLYKQWTDNLVDCILNGYSVGISADGMYLDQEGEIGSYSHALTLMGVEVDDKGYLARMWLTDSDDATSFGTDMGLFSVSCAPIEDMTTYGISKEDYLNPPATVEEFNWAEGNVAVFSMKSDVADEKGKLWYNGYVDEDVFDYFSGYSAIRITPLVDSNVPEPATGTLSLLALAGLAARRRRK